MRRWVFYLVLLICSAGSFYWALGEQALPARRGPAPERRPDRAHRRFDRQLELQRVIRPKLMPVATGPTSPRREMSHDTTVAPSRILGRVVDDRGRSVRAAWVHLVVNYGSGQDVTYDGKLRKREQTGTQGQFLFDELAPGDYLVYARAPDDYAKLDARLVRLQPGETAELELTTRKRSIFQLRGRVVDRRGEPLHFVRVVVRATSVLDGALLEDGSGHTGMDGSFVIDVASPAWYELELRDSGGAPRARTRLFADDDTGEATVTINEDSVRCALLDAHGRVVPFRSYTFGIERNGGASTGMGGLSSHVLGSTLRFLWPSETTKVSVQLEGRELTGSIELRGPAQPCQIQGGPPPALP